VTRHMLRGAAAFDENSLTFDLRAPPKPEIARGRYHLISKARPQAQESGGDGVNQFLYRLSHPLGQHVLEAARALPTPPAEIVFDISNHPTRLSVVEALKGKAGWLTLRLLAVESYDREEHLLFSGFTDGGSTLDQETLERLFLCAAREVRPVAAPSSVETRLEAEAERHAKATLSRSLEANSRYFQEAREKLERWADDMVLAAEKALADTKEQLKVLHRQARQAPTLEEQKQIQEKIRRLEQQQRRQRQEIFQVEDEIMGKRDGLIDQLEQRLAQRTETETLFTIRWAVA